MKYYLASLSWNVAGQEIWPVWSKNDIGLGGFKQDFERAWEPVEHDTPMDCLATARDIIPNAQLCLSHDESEVLIIEQDRAEKLYRIERDME